MRTRYSTTAGSPTQESAKNSESDAVRIRGEVEKILAQVTGALSAAAEKDPDVAARAMKEALQAQDVNCAFVARFMGSLSDALGGTHDMVPVLDDIDRDGFELVAFNPSSPRPMAEDVKTKTRTTKRPISSVSVPVQTRSSKRQKGQNPQVHRSATTSYSQQSGKSKIASKPSMSSGFKHRRSDKQQPVGGVVEMDEDDGDPGSPGQHRDDENDKLGEDLAAAEFDALDDDGHGASPSAAQGRSSSRRPMPSFKARNIEQGISQRRRPAQKSDAPASQLAPASDLRNDLKEGNIEPCWHKGITIIHDILATCPLDPQQIVHQAMSLLQPLNKDRISTLSQQNTRDDIPATIDRLEDNHSLHKSLAVYSLIEHLHLFAMDRQARVDAKLLGRTDTLEKVERTKLRIAVKPGGFLMQGTSDWRLNGLAIEIPGLTSGTSAALPPINDPDPRGPSTSEQDSSSGPLNQEERNSLKAKNAFLRNPLRAGRLFHELGCVMGSVVLIPLLLLSRALDDPAQQVRQLTSMEWQALILLLRGDRPLPISHRTFTATDQQILDAISFGVRGVLSRVCAHALALCDALAEKGAGSHDDVLVVRAAHSEPVLGNEEPSAYTSAAHPDRVYGLTQHPTRRVPEGTLISSISVGDD